MKLERRFHPEAVLSPQKIGRPVLEVAHLIEIKGEHYLLATDSYCGVMLPVEATEADAAGAVTPLALQLARRFQPSREPLTIICQDGLSVPSVGTLDRPSPGSPPTEGIAKALEPKKNYAFEIGMSPAIIANLAKALGTGKNRGLRFSFEGQIKPVHVSVIGDENVRGVLMPIRVAS